MREVSGSTPEYDKYFDNGKSKGQKSLTPVGLSEKVPGKKSPTGVGLSEKWRKKRRTEEKDRGEGQRRRTEEKDRGE